MTIRRRKKRSSRPPWLTDVHNGVPSPSWAWQQHYLQVTLLLLLYVCGIHAGSGDRRDYQGLFIGKFNSYSHQVMGDVYAVDESTLLIKNFFYDGLGTDTFFWAGASIRPSPIGFIVPDETGATNKLLRYIDKDITIKLPDDKALTAIKWFAVWDIRTSKNFADIYIPDGFDPPSSQRVAEFSRLGHAVRSGPIIVLDSKRIYIPNFSYDGGRKDGEQVTKAFFWVGHGPVPNPSGHKIPDENGYLDPLGKYKGDDITLELPGEETFFDIDWISVWDEERATNLGHVNIPDGLNIPPAIVKFHKIESRMPNCEQLHRKVQINWEIFGPQITFEVNAQIDPDDYVSLGISGEESKSVMLGSDVAISYLDGHIGFTYDYNITDLYPCTNVLGMYKGVCPDELVGGVNNYQIHTFTREDGITRLTYRRNLINTGDEGDLLYQKDAPTQLVWAVGRLNKFKEPRYHHIYPRGDWSINFGRKPAAKNCFPFTTVDSLSRSAQYKLEEDQFAKVGIKTKQAGRQRPGEQVHTFKSRTDPWGPLTIKNRTATTYYARIGEPGAFRGYMSSNTIKPGSGTPGLVWYMNGLLAPYLTVRRGFTYIFKVEGGSNPSKARFYHPLYITDDEHGGYIKYKDGERSSFTVYAGIEWDRKGRPRPTAAGRLCLWAHKSPDDDPRRADSFHSFIGYRDSLRYDCERGSAATLVWTPNASTPDVVYYQSYTQRNMGGKIIVVDDFLASSSATSNTMAAKTLFGHHHFTLSAILPFCLLCFLLLVRLFIHLQII